MYTECNDAELCIIIFRGEDAQCLSGVVILEQINYLLTKKPPILHRASLYAEHVGQNEFIVLC